MGGQPRGQRFERFGTACWPGGAFAHHPQPGRHGARLKRFTLLASMGSDQGKSGPQDAPARTGASESAGAWDPSDRGTAECASMGEDIRASIKPSMWDHVNVW